MRGEVPEGCIEMIADGRGFKRPAVDADICVGCGGCDSVCPAIGERAKDGAKSVIWAKSKDKCERLASSSGGLFGLLAREVLVSGGAVCGAAWVEGCKRVRHEIVEDEAGSMPSCAPSTSRARWIVTSMRALGRPFAAAGASFSRGRRARSRA